VHPREERTRTDVKPIARPYKVVRRTKWSQEYQSVSRQQSSDNSQRTNRSEQPVSVTNQSPSEQLGVRVK